MKRVAPFLVILIAFCVILTGCPGAGGGGDIIVQVDTKDEGGGDTDKSVKP